MTQNILWSSAQAWTALFGSTDLNALASGSQKTSSGSVISNNTVGSIKPYIQFAISLASLTPAVAGNILLALVAQNQDASTYSTGTDGTTVATQVQYLNGVYWCAALQAGVASALQYVSPPLLLPPGIFKAVLINRSGVALGATGNQAYYSLNQLGVG